MLTINHPTMEPTAFTGANQIIHHAAMMVSAKPHIMHDSAGTPNEQSSRVLTLHLFKQSYLG